MPEMRYVSYKERMQRSDEQCERAEALNAFYKREQPGLLPSTKEAMWLLARIAFWALVFGAVVAGFLAL
jgi:hypothetical protein